MSAPMPLAASTNMPPTTNTTATTAMPPVTTATSTTTATMNTAQVNEELYDILKTRIPQQVYKREWEMYKDWLEEVYLDPESGVEMELDAPPTEEWGGKVWTTRNNLDAYFKYVVVHRDGEPDYIRRIVPALKWFAINYEGNKVDPSLHTDFESTIMKHALEAQKFRYGAYKESSVDDKCPHRYCKNTLSIDQRKRLLVEAYNRVDWSSATVAMNLGHNIALRGASIRKLTMCDLRLAEGYGPDSNKSNGDPRFDRTLMTILRKGAAHKDRFKNTKQVCMWRHREYILDPNFSLSLCVIEKLRNTPGVSFRKGDGGQRPKWWDLQIIGWKTLNGQCCFR